MVIVALLVVYFCSLQHVLADIVSYNNSAFYQAGYLGLYPTQHFFSDPDVIAPVANVIADRQREDGTSYTMLTWAAHGRGVAPVGPQLLDAENFSVVYQAPLYSGLDTFGISTATCDGTQYLVYWSGKRQFRRTVGRYFILNSTYHVVWNISAIGFAGADAHSGVLTHDCHFVITVHEPQRHDLEEVGLDKDSWIMECYIQTIDLATGKLVFQWRSTDHVPLEEALVATHNEYRGEDGVNPWDFLHINSVTTDHLGNYLISARNTNTLYYIDGASKDIIWRLGSGNNDFVDLSEGAATDFICQHDARWLNRDLTRMSLFDNRACTDVEQADPVSRGIILELNYTSRTVRLESEYRAPDNISSSRQGGIQVMENDNVLLSFGNEPVLSEYSRNGTILRDVRFGPVMLHKFADTPDNYRSSPINWTGNPSWSPLIAPGPSLNRVPYDASNAVWPAQLDNRTNDTAYFSWNGATRLTQWLVLSFNTAPEITTTTTTIRSEWKTVPKTGFETGLYIGGVARYIQVIALDRDDNMLDHGMSAILDMHTGHHVAFGAVERPGSMTATADQVAVEARNHARDQYARWRRGRSTRETGAMNLSRVIWSVAAPGLLVMLSYMVYLRRN